MNDLTAITERYGDLSRFQDCPPFWTPMARQAMPVIEALKQARVRTIGQSAGGRDILAIEYGDKEPLQTVTDNLQSALASKLVPPDPTDIFPAAFYGTSRRKKPVVVIQGAIHGGEHTGTVAAINLCRVIETGKDLRGREWPELAELARSTRLAIIPWLNPDGAERWPIPNPDGAPLALMSAATLGVAGDGTFYKYPAVKSIQPIPPDKTRFMGAYYNDAGVNLQYDFTSVERQPETAAWMRYYLDERPDGVVIWHCNAGSMIGPPEFYLPVGHQHEVSRLGGAVRDRLLRDGYEIGRMSWACLPGMGKPYIEQMTAVYHVCGGLPIMCELPCGGADYSFTLDDLLDIGLITIEEILFYAHHDGLRPYEVWDKVKKTLA